MNKTEKITGAATRTDRLLADLSKVARILREQVRLEKSDGPMTAIVRLVPGLNLPSWQEISARELDQNWIALDLNSCRIEAETNSSQNSLNGMWLADAFIRVLDQAMYETLQSGLTLSLILFQVDDLDPNQTRHYSLILRVISSQIWDSASEQDLLGHLTPNLFAFALPDCSPFQARAMAENIIILVGKVLQRLGLGIYPMRAGIVSQPCRCCQLGGADDFIAKARKVLELTAAGQKSELKQRINMEKDATVEQAMETLVLADEKQILFTGGR